MIEQTLSIASSTFAWVIGISFGFAAAAGGLWATAWACVAAVDWWERT